MRNLEAIREKYEKEIRLAKIENSFEEKLGNPCRVFESIGKTFVAIEVSNAIAGRILREYPPTAIFQINSTATGSEKPINDNYRLESYRGWHDLFSTLKVEYCSGDIWFWLEIRINDNEVLTPFFNGGEREMSGSEMDTYKPNNGSRLYQSYKLPCMRFKSEQISYYGGRFVCTNHETIKEIIEALKAV